MVDVEVGGYEGVFFSASRGCRKCLLEAGTAPVVGGKGWWLNRLPKVALHVFAGDEPHGHRVVCASRTFTDRGQRAAIVLGEIRGLGRDGVSESWRRLL